MSLLLSIAIPLTVLYGLFLVWYGGNGQPLSKTEIERFMRDLNANARNEKDRTVADEAHLLLAGDDGK